MLPYWADAATSATLVVASLFLPPLSADNLALQFLVSVTEAGTVPGVFASWHRLPWGLLNLMLRVHKLSLGMGLARVMR